MFNGSPREALAQYKESSDKMYGHIQNAMGAFVVGGLALLVTAFLYVSTMLGGVEDDGDSVYLWWIGGAGVVALIVGLYQRSRYLELAPKVHELREDVEALTGIDPYTGRPSD